MYDSEFWFEFGGNGFILVFSGQSRTMVIRKWEEIGKEKFKLGAFRTLFLIFMS